MDRFAQPHVLLQDTSNQSVSRLTRLPPVVIRMILESDVLETRDRKAASLACHTLRDHAQPRLFRRIVISQLWRDRCAFLSICDTPHLAKYVREVNWQEISWHPGFFSRALTWGIKDSLGGRLDELVSDLFWLHMEPPSLLLDQATSKLNNGYDSGQADLVIADRDSDLTKETSTVSNSDAIRSQRQERIEQFREIFEMALSHLPNLRSVLSGPMDPHRDVRSDGYALKALNFQNKSATRSGDARPLHQANDGLFLYLFPAMKKLRLPITELCWEDEYQFDSFFRAPTDLTVFTRLETLKISLFFPTSFSGCHPKDALNSVLEAAESVRHLVLSCNYSSLANIAKIKSCQLVSLDILSYPEINDADLLAILKRNSGTLRHLRLESSSLSRGLFSKIRHTVFGLQLESLCILGDPDSGKYVPESHILEYLNHQNPDAELKDHCCSVFDWANIAMTHGPQSKIIEHGYCQKPNDWMNNHCCYDFDRGKIVLERNRIYTEENFIVANQRECSGDSEGSWDKAMDQDEELGDIGGSEMSFGEDYTQAEDIEMNGESRDEALSLDGSDGSEFEYTSEEDDSEESQFESASEGDDSEGSESDEQLG